MKRIIEWHSDPLTAKLGVINLEEIPFPIRRFYWISDFKNNAVRGNHAHKNLMQLMIPIAGSFELVLFDGSYSETIRLSAGNEPVVIKPGIWRIMKNASEDSVILVLASELYDESDYIRDWKEYLEWHSARK
jgi:hypothetical protein